MQRVLRPGGTTILLETLGTGQETLHPPTPELAALYDLLQIKYGFNQTRIRTDYCFAALSEAEKLTRFFFGEELARAVRWNNWIILPECTGIWWLHNGSQI